MKTLDINGDGELSHEEFLKGLKMNSSIAEKMGMTNHELSLQEQGAKITDMPPDNEDTIFKVPIFLFRARAHICVNASDAKLSPRPKQTVPTHTHTHSITYMYVYSMDVCTYVYNM